jgi:hypothetical protein
MKHGKNYNSVLPVLTAFFRMKSLIKHTSRFICNNLVLMLSCSEVTLVAYFRILPRNFTEWTDNDQEILKNISCFGQGVNCVSIKFRSGILTDALPKLSVSVYQRQFKTASFSSEDGDIVFLQTIVICLQVHTFLQPRKATSTCEYVTVGICIIIK